MYSDKTAGYFNNGTFKVTDENGQDRIYGQYGSCPSRMLLTVS